VVVCWGYEKEAAASLMGRALPRAAASGARCSSRAPLPRLARCGAAPRRIPWFRTLLLALPLLLLLLRRAWLLRELLPADPDRRWRRARDRRRRPPRRRRPIRRRRSKASLSTEEARARAPSGRARTIEVRAQTVSRVQAAVVEGTAPGPDRRRAPQGTADKNSPKPRRSRPPCRSHKPAPPPHRRSRSRSVPSTANALAGGATNDFSFIGAAGRTESVQARAHSSSTPASRPTASTPTAMAASSGGAAAPPAAHGARAVFNGDLALRDQDTTCNDGSHGTPTSWCAGAAPTTSPTATAVRRARWARPRGS
jgi:hypothetical protein